MADTHNHLEQLTEENNIRAKSRNYARLFLSNNYKDEYKELAEAYCKNRGVLAIRSHGENGVPIVDERTGQVFEPTQIILTEEEKKHKARVRTDASTYARTFLVNKYKEEYLELAEAYCKNRGIKLYKRKMEILVDERELMECEDKNFRVVEMENSDA